VGGASTVHVEPFRRARNMFVPTTNAAEGAGMTTSRIDGRTETTRMPAAFTLSTRTELKPTGNA
jgi:hypothetical protein